MRSTIAGALALAGLAALTACAGSGPAPDSAAAGSTAAAGSPAAVTAPTATTSAAATATAAATPAATATTARPATTRTPAKTTTAAADVSQLKKLGILLDEGVLIDVADDGADRYLAIGKNSAVDFTGTTRTDTTMMALKAAPGGKKNQVVIKPPFWNEDLGKGSCVADTSGAPLKLETCATGRAAQIWTVVPAGDSGQFELHGSYGVLKVENGKLTTGSTGRVGLQTIAYAK